MAVLQANTSANISVPAGYSLTFAASGSGTAVIANGQEAGTSYRLGSSQQTIGPFSTDRVVSVAAVATLSYVIGGAVIPLLGQATPTDTALAPYGLSANAIGRTPVGGFVTSVACGILGQSTELGAVLEPDSKGVMRKAFLSAPSQGYIEPDPLAPGQSGSYFTEVFQRLATKYKLKVFAFNGALGGASMVREFTGVLNVSGWAANRAYRTARAAGTAQNCQLLITTNSTTTATCTAAQGAKLVVGMSITGNANITNGTTVTAIAANLLSFTLSAAATGTASNVLTTFTSPNTIVGDPGTKGELILESGRIWECTSGNTHLAFIDSDVGVYVGGQTWRRNLSSVAKDTDRTSANSGAKPTFSGAAVVGDTVTDNGTGSTGGGLVWTCRAVSAPAADADGLRVLRRTDYGFDPYFAMNRLITAILGAPVSADKKYVIVQNAQSDANIGSTNTNTSTLYRFARWFITTEFATYGIKVLHGLSIFFPVGGGQGFTQDQYDALQTVLSNGGYGTTPDYANSPLSTSLGSSGYTRIQPGASNSLTSQYGYIDSLYLKLGLDVQSLLQAVGNPHPTLVAAKGVIPDAFEDSIAMHLLDVAALPAVTA